MNNNSNNVIKRQLLIIQYLIASNYVSTLDIQTYLKSRGMNAQIRTIQRDLNLLNEIVPLEVRTDDKPYSWRWKRLKNTSKHNLGIAQALALRIVETELKGVIPNDLYEQLEPLFEKSHFVIGLAQIEESEKKNFKPIDIKGIGIVSMSPFSRIVMSLRARIEHAKNKNEQRRLSSNEDSLTEITDEQIKTIDTLGKELEAKELSFLNKLLKNKF